jgi:hypothetical protein
MAFWTFLDSSAESRSPDSPNSCCSTDKQDADGELARPFGHHVTECMQLVRPVSFEEALYVLCCGDIDNLDYRSIVAGFHQHCYENREIYPVLQEWKFKSTVWAFERIMLYVLVRSFARVNIHFWRSRAAAAYCLRAYSPAQAIHNVHSSRAFYKYLGLQIMHVSEKPNVSKRDRMALQTLVRDFQLWQSFRNAMSDSNSDVAREWARMSISTVAPEPQSLVYT